MTPRPTTFGFQIATLFAPASSLELRGEELLWELITESGPIDEDSISPTDKQWAEFWAVLDDIDAWSWSGGYGAAPEETGNDTRWSWHLRLKYEDHEVYCNGSGAQPQRQEGAGERWQELANGSGQQAGEIGPDFERFCLAVSKLSGGREFADLSVEAGAE